MEPAKELSGGLLDGGPEAKPGETLVIAEERGKDIIQDFTARGEPAAGNKVHDVGIAVEFDEVVHIGHGEPAQRQALGFQEDLHSHNRPRVRSAAGPERRRSRPPPVTAAAGHGRHRSRPPPGLAWAPRCLIPGRPVPAAPDPWTTCARGSRRLPATPRGPGRLPATPRGPGRLPATPRGPGRLLAPKPGLPIWPASRLRYPGS